MEDSFLGQGARMGERVEQVHDPRARAWEGLHQPALEVLLQQVPPPRELWDIACGQGAFSKLVLEAEYHVHAVDGDIQQCRVLGVSCESLDLNDVAQVEHFIRTQDGRADVTVALELIEHLLNPWVFTQFCADLTKPSGYILLSIPHIGSIYSRLLFLRTGHFLMFQGYRSPFGHMNPVTAAELETIVAHCRPEIAVKAFPCKMPSRETMRHRLGMLAGCIVRRFAKGDIGDSILMYLLGNAGTVWRA